MEKKVTLVKHALDCPNIGQHLILFDIYFHSFLGGGLRIIKRHKVKVYITLLISLKTSNPFVSTSLFLSLLLSDFVQRACKLEILKNPSLAYKVILSITLLKSD